MKGTANGTIKSYRDYWYVDPEKIFASLPLTDLVEPHRSDPKICSERSSDQN